MTDTVFILDRNKNVIDYLSNNGVSPDAPFFDDIYIQELSNGAETYEFSTLSNVRTSEALELGNYVVFKYDNKYKMFQIMDLEDDHKEGKQIINCYCEMAGLELLTDYCEPFSVEGNVELFFNTVLQDTNWSLGGYSSSLATNIQQVKVDKYTNVYKVIQENIGTYGNVEIEYRVEFDGNRLLGYFIDVYENGYRGSKVYKRFEYGENVSGITRKRNLNDFASAMIGQGKDNLTFKDIEWKKSNGDPTDKPKGQDFVVDLEANDKFNKHGKYIKGLFDDSDITNPQDLLLKSWEKLQEVKEPKFDYDVELALTSVEYEDIKIGDTNYVIDNDYNPPIFLEARIGKLEISLTDPNKNKCTLSNYKEIVSKTRKDISEDEINEIVNTYFPIGGDKIEQGAIGNGHIDTTYYESIKTDIVQASVADVQVLISNKANITDLNATNASIESLKSNKANIEDLNATNATINNLKADKASVSELNAVKAQIGTLEAGEIVADKLHSQDANIKNLTSNKANISDLNATNATVGNLNADVGKINTLLAKKATIEDLNVVKAQIGTLNVGEVIADIIHGNTADIGDLTADIGEIQTLVGENLTMKNIASLILTSKKVTVEDAFIKNAMIDSVSAAKINTGILNTNLVNIQSEDGSLVLNGTLQQFKDENGKVRIQMGKDAQGNFTFGLFDSTGTGTLIDSDGITEKAIGDGIIVDKMVGEDANISGSKLDIDSIITEVNNGTSTIKGSKVKLDETNQTLDVAFNTLNTTVANTGKTVESQGTSIETMQGEIKTLITNTTITEGDTTTTIKDAYSSLKQNVGEFGVALKEVESDFNNMVIGGRNLLFGTGFDLTNNPTTIWANYAGEVKTGGVNNQNYYHMDNSSNTSYKDMLRQIIYNSANKKIKPNSWYTLSFYVKGTVGSKLRTHVYPRTIGTSIKGFVDNVETALTGDGSCDWVMTNEWVRHTYTFYTNPENAMIESGEQAVLFRINAGTIVDICMPMLEEATKVGAWSKAQEDTDGALTSIGTRVKDAETKLTLDGLKTTIGSTYTTPSDVEGKITSKGYATTADVTQATNNWSAKFTESGGYNLLYNGDFRNALNNWIDGGNLPAVLCTTLGCPDNMNGIDMGGQIGKTVNYYQEFEYQKIGKMTLSYWTYITSSGVNGTTNPFSNIQVTVWHSDGTVAFLTPPAPSQSQTWEKVKFTINLTKRPTKIRVALYNRDTTKRLYFTNIMLEDGEIANAFTPNPNEVFDGITEISKNGIRVTQSNYNGYTNMRADGFYLNDGKEDVIKCTSTGLVVKGTVNVINGSISESALAGTLIDGQYIKTGTIQANSMSIGDFNNYCTQPTNFTITAGSDTGSPGYKVSGTQHMFITSKLTQLRGGEQFSITGKAYGSSTNTTQTNLNFQFIWRDASGNAVSTGGLAAVAVNINTTIDVNLVLTVPPRPQNAIYGNIKIFVGNNIETLIYFQPNIRLMMTGNLIVDGAIDGKTIRGAEIIGGEIKSIGVNEAGNPIFSLSSDGRIVGGYIDCYGLNVEGDISADTLSINSINNSRYPQALDEDITVYINTSVISDEDMIDGAKFSCMEDLFAVAPRNLNGYIIFIIFETDYTGNINLSAFNSGSCYLYLQKHTIRGYISCYGKSMRYAIYGNARGLEGGSANCANIKPSKGRNMSGYAYSLICDYTTMTAYDLNVYPGVDTTVTPSGIIVTNLSNAYLNNINAVGKPQHLVRSHSTSQVYIAGSSGLAAGNAFSAVSGSIQCLNTTNQAGSLIGKPTYTSGNAQIFSNGVTFAQADNSGSNDSGSSTTEVTTVTLKANSGDTYRRTVYNSWKKDGTVRQGDYGYGDCDGFWFFGSQISNYTGKKITKVAITIKRNTGAGSSSPVTHTLVGHEYSSRPSGTPKAMGSVIRSSFNLSQGNSVTLNLTAAEIAIFKKYKGIGLKAPYSSSYYSSCSASCTVKITYEE